MKTKKLHLHSTLVLFFAAALLLGTAAILPAQDSKVPGGNYVAPLASEVRNGKLVFEAEDGSFRWWFDARIQYDGAYFFENKNELSSGTVLRRSTFAMKSVLYKDWQAEIDLDFGDGVLDMRDVWVRFDVPNTNFAIQAGNFKEPFGMERLNSSRLLTFLERSAPTNAFAMGRRVGIAGRYYNKYGQVCLGAFGHETGTRIDKGQRDEAFSGNLRISAAPINLHGKNLHIGFAFSRKNPETLGDVAPNGVEVKARTENYVSDPKPLHTGTITDVNYYDRLGGELMGIKGPFYFQSEVFSQTMKRWYGKSDVNLWGAYATFTWTPTGETRFYYVDEGEVGPVEKAKRSWGAVELCARFSYTDLNDLEAGIHGGESRQLMLGINYYPNPAIKLQFNYSRVNLDQYATRNGNMFGNDDHSFIQGRIQASL
ncbi:MAG TPA: porin [bacterium]|nr:porin [bacterium]HQG44064.1 porin [bacterium]HQJ65223.1 porin [bacterium]